jgi:hypothetical protein
LAFVRFTSLIEIELITRFALTVHHQVSPILDFGQIREITIQVRFMSFVRTTVRTHAHRAINAHMMPMENCGRLHLPLDQQTAFREDVALFGILTTDKGMSILTTAQRNWIRLVRSDCSRCMIKFAQ